MNKRNDLPSQNTLKSFFGGLSGNGRAVKTLLYILCLSLPFGCSDTSKPKNVVELYGDLSLDGIQLVGSKGEPVVLHGMSLFWSQFVEGAPYYNEGTVKWLKDDWHCTVIRAAMGIEPRGYLTDPETEKAKVRAVVDAAIEQGIYVIIDWHDHHGEKHREEAKAFFKEMATLYGNYPNVIYEIYNEPIRVSWTDDIKPYAEEVIKEIRSVDPDNLIIVGTPFWSQSVDDASRDPLEGTNIACTLHFYTSTHKQSLRDKAVTAMENGMALFVSEMGISEASGNGKIKYPETEEWIQFCADNKLSWCNWSIVHKDETSAALVKGASPTGNWKDSDLTESGKYMRNVIREKNAAVLELLAK